MKLREDKEALVLTGALGNYTVDELSKAALSTFPSVAALRGGFKFDSRSPGKDWHTRHRDKRGGWRKPN
eukprot:1275119-Lingulodinium_polyedra.AAC.1